MQYVDKEFVGAKSAAFLDVWVKAGTDSISQPYGPGKKPYVDRTALVRADREARFKQA